MKNELLFRRLNKLRNNVMADWIRHLDSGSWTGMTLTVVSIILLWVAVSFASTCRIERIEWVGEHSEFEELSMSAVVGMPCDSWHGTKQKLLRYYEDHGFLGAKLDVNVDSAGVMRCRFERGSAWVWAEPENLDSGL